MNISISAGNTITRSVDSRSWQLGAISRPLKTILSKAYVFPHEAGFFTIHQ